jgi:hypothetical protein
VISKSMHGMREEKGIDNFDVTFVRNFETEIE